MTLKILGKLTSVLFLVNRIFPIALIQLYFFSINGVSPFFKCHEKRETRDNLALKKQVLPLISFSVNKRDQDAIGSEAWQFHKLNGNVLYLCFQKLIKAFLTYHYGAQPLEG